MNKPFSLSIILNIEQSSILRGRRVILDSDLAGIYDGPIKALNQAVNRNAGRFPDFAFQLTYKEVTILLRSQSVTQRGPGAGHNS